MALRILEIQQLHNIGERSDLLPDELRDIGLILVFDILYDADVYTRDAAQRGGTWGVHFDHRQRRQGNVLLQLHGYLKISEQAFLTSSGRSQIQRVYHITDKGRELLQKLKDAAGIE